jgi:class 3 adenylate cyclase
MIHFDNWRAEQMLLTTRQKSVLPRFLAFALAIGVFVFDALSPLEFAVAVLYVVVVLIAATYLDRRSVLIAATGCVALTLLSLLLVHSLTPPDTATLRAAISLAAIGITTFLALKNLSTNDHLELTRRQRANLARFCSPQLVDELSEMDTPLSLTRYQPAAVLFVDMLGFTAYCSKMTPEEVIALLRDLQALLSKCVFSQHGTIDKFLGDGLMAVFGPPLPSSADATNAARCALEILRSIDSWNEQYHRLGDGAIRVAIGIHYGQIVQGDIGSENQMELTVVGDTVNIASRVEAYCRTLDSAMLVTASFVDQLYAEGSIDLAEILVDLRQHLLRGRAEPVHLYGIRRPVSRQDDPIPAVTACIG